MAHSPLIASIPSAPEPESGRPVNRGVVAGSLIVGAMLACAGAGLGVGALLGVPVLLGLAGLFAGFVVGLILVFNRFRDL
jgi:hypothetical protein